MDPSPRSVALLYQLVDRDNVRVLAAGEVDAGTDGVRRTGESRRRRFGEGVHANKRAASSPDRTRRGSRGGAQNEHCDGLLHDVNNDADAVDDTWRRFERCGDRTPTS